MITGLLPPFLLFFGGRGFGFVAPLYTESVIRRGGHVHRKTYAGIGRRGSGQYWARCWCDPQL